MKADYFDLDKLADDIYSACYGHLDDKQFRDAKTTEIRDWLAIGDIVPSLTSIINEWRDYDADDIAQNAETIPDPAFACPKCGENRVDWLVCNADDDTVTCGSCGKTYKI